MESLHPPHGQPPLPVAPTPAQYTDGYGIASIVMALFFITIPGLIVGLIGVSKAKRLRVSPVVSRVGWILNLVFLVIFTLLAAIGFAIYIANSEEVNSELSSLASPAPSTVEGGGASLEIPSSYESISSDYEDADIARGDLGSEAYIITYHDAVEDIAGNISATGYADMSYEMFSEESGYSEQTRAQLPAGTIPNPRGYEVADYQIMATYEGRIFVYFMRHVRTPTNYYTLMSWTVPSYLEANRGTLLGILGSFKEI